MMSMDFFRALRRELLAPVVFGGVFVLHQVMLWGIFTWLSAAPPPNLAPAQPNYWLSAAALLLVQALAAVMAYCVLRLPRTVRLPLLLLAFGVFVDVAALGFQASFNLTLPGGWSLVPPLLLVVSTIWLALISRSLVTQRLHAERDLAEKDLALTHLAERDFLTGLLNRTGFHRRLTLLTRQHGAALVLIDLNDLKAINDSGGHSAGDQQLQHVAQALQSALPPGALLARWGGDEFVAALPQASSVQARAFADLAAQRAAATGPAARPFAVGVAQLQPQEDLERVLAVADQQMYEDKAEAQAQRMGGANGVSVPSLDDFTRMLESLETKHAILQDGLDALRTLLGFDGSSYYERRGDLIFPTYVTGLIESQLAHRTEQLGRPLGSGIVGQAILNDATLGIADYPGERGALPEWRSSGLKSVVVTPVRDAGHIVGVLDLTSYSTWRAITPQVRRLLEAVALRMGHVLERERVVSRLQQLAESQLLALGVGARGPRL